MGGGDGGEGARRLWHGRSGVGKTEVFGGDGTLRGLTSVLLVEVTAAKDISDFAV
jgi:hypothetical protein